MQFSIEWQVPGRILFCRIAGDISANDAQAIADGLEQHIQSGRAPVHIIVDMAEMGSFPASVSKLNQMSRWVYNVNTGWIITLSPGRLLSFVGSLVTGMAGVKYRSVNSLQEARTLLSKFDISVPIDAHS